MRRSLVLHLEFGYTPGSVEDGLEKTTVKNPKGTIGDNTNVERDGDSLEHDEINPSENLADCEESTESDLEETTIRNPDNGSLKEQEEQDLSENLKDFAEELRSQIRNFDIALEGSAENGLEETTDRNPENTTEREDKTELLTPGVHKARVPIARLRDALDDEELGDKSGFRCAVC